MSGPAHRRINPRYDCFYFAHFRQPNAVPGGPEHLCVTNNFSHDGIYFLAFDDMLREKMQLLLKFSYHDRRTVKAREYLVQIVRINPLFQRRCGVGARLVFDTPARLHHGLLLPEPIDRQPDLLRIDVYA